MSLYQTYRPKAWSDLEGQDHIVKTISTQITQGTLSHAYMLFGPRGVGKTTTARLIAKAANCTSRTAENIEPCGECPACKHIDEGSSPDIIEIDAASHTKVEEVRETIIASLPYPPTELRYKVFIVDEVHMLSNSSFNALLKSLEEPPERVIFILATTDIHKVPATIVSRCQRYGFKKVSAEDIIRRLSHVLKKENRTADDAVLSMIAKKSDGALRDALTILDQTLSVSDTHVTINDLLRIIPEAPTESILAFLAATGEKDAQKIVISSRAIMSTGAQTGRALDQLIELSHQALSLKHNIPTNLLNITEDEAARLKEATLAYSAIDLHRVIDMGIQRKSEIKYLPYGELAFELIGLSFCTNSTEIHKSPTKETNSAQKTITPQIPPKETVAAKPTEISTAPKIEPQKAPPTETIEHTKEEKITTEQKVNVVPYSTWQASFGKLITEVEKTSASLALVLRNVTLSEGRDGGAVFSVPFALHADQLELPQKKKCLLDAMAIIFGTTPLYTVVVQPKEHSGTEENTAISAFANAIGATGNANA